MSNRFHNKYHKSNHHTAPAGATAYDADSALDPIASESSPFLGGFHLSGDLIVSTGYGITADTLDVQTATASVVSGQEIIVDNITAESTEIFMLSDLDIGTNIIIGLTLDKLTNVDMVTEVPVVGDFLYYDGGDWIPSDPTVIIATDLEAQDPNEEDKAINPKQLFNDRSQTSVYDSTTYTTNGATYTNPSDRKILVICCMYNSNDISIEAYIGATTATNLVAQQLIISDGSSASVGSVTFMVPPTWKFKVTGSTNILSYQSWEI